MSLVQITDHDGVWLVELSRPPVNAIDLAMVEALHAAVARAAARAARDPA